MRRSKGATLISSGIAVLAMLFTLGSAQTASAAPSQYSEKTVVRYSSDSGSKATITMTWYSCDGTYKCAASMDVAVEDVHTDGRGAIVHAQFIDKLLPGNTKQQPGIYLHETRGKGYSSSAQQYNQPYYGLGERTQYLWVRVCNGGSKDASNNCNSYTFDDPYSS